MLAIRDLAASYNAVTALHGISLQVEKGGIVTLIGANGAGKSTALRVISGLVRAAGGSVALDGRDITNLPPHRIVQAGISHVPEGRMIFPKMTVAENLAMGAFLRRDRKAVQASVHTIFEFFPRLAERQRQQAGTLSGGEQQMLAIGRALMAEPRLLMLDEPSLGIAPLLVEAIFEQLVRINKTQGITMLLVEQNANLALEISHYAYVLETGRIVLHGESAPLRSNPEVQRSYLGG
jgi:branched-chain amino acid transport system ATP-binding protein